MWEKLGISKKKMLNFGGSEIYSIMIPYLALGDFYNFFVKGTLKHVKLSF